MATPTIPMTAPADVYCSRRKRLAATLARPLLLAAGRARGRQYATNTFPFRAGSSYLYFGGPPVEGGALLIEPGADGADGCTLFRDVFGFEDAVWIGATPPDDVLVSAAGLDVRSLVGPEKLASMVAGRDAAYVVPPCPSTIDWVRSAGLAEASEAELLPIVDMRLIKDEHELVAMRRAADATVAAHVAAMHATSPGCNECEVASALHAALIARQCSTSFAPIVSVRGEVLHQASSANVVKENDLLLVDAGGEEHTGYASDVTRTFPVSGSFSGIQRQLYDTVLRAEQQAIAACVPGARYRDVHDLAARVVCEGLVDADLLRGEPEDLWGRGAHTLFFPHGVGHLIGLDVHDMEDFGDLAGYAKGRSRRTQFGSKFLRLDRDLLPGMVVTIEPGIYLVPAIWSQDELVRPFADVVNRPAVEALLDTRFGGIRIEDVVRVRGTGGPPQADRPNEPEVLTANLASGAEEVASIVSGA